jgi:hypothetical protein
MVADEPEREFWRRQWVRITSCFVEEAKLTTLKGVVNEVHY